MKAFNSSVLGGLIFASTALSVNAYAVTTVNTSPSPAASAFTGASNGYANYMRAQQQREYEESTTRLNNLRIENIHRQQREYEESTARLNDMRIENIRRQQYYSREIEYILNNPNATAEDLKRADIMSRMLAN